MVYGVSWQEGDFGTGAAPESIVGPKGTIILDSDQAFTWRHAPARKKRFSWDLDRLRPRCAEPGWEWRIYRRLDTFLRGAKRDYRLTTGQEALASLWMAEKILAAGPDGRMFRFRQQS